MDVQCERCKTEYEFDDALVSGRGTTVRCTHCGHQFKVRRTDGSDTAGDRWVVQTGNGQELTFLTLRELQRAILAKQVARNDTLLLGEATLRPLGSITELEPFFQGRSSSRPPPPAVDGDAVQGSASLPVVPARRTQAFGPAPGSQLSATTQTGPAPISAPPPNETRPPVDARTPSLPPPTVPVRRSMATGDDEVHDIRSDFPPQRDDAFDFPRRRRVGGWVVALVLLMAVAVVGWVLAKPYVVARNTSGETGAQLDARAQAFLAGGENALLEGDLDGAQQDFDKASALAERDPRVLLNEARVAAARADVPWLKLRLLTPDAPEEMRTTRAQLDESVARASTAADDAVSAAPDDRAAVRAKIDALRLQGQRDVARTYVAKLSAIASQPETAYVLAALDLAE
ncbi:MAG: zinc-ribbon domain-containing protein, partial [Myxococcota bacterium]|nr:zinc-ribbon domain-containing protein [Myxococcota bacterium]